MVVPDHDDDGIRIRAARPGDAAALSALAYRSKAHWGYPPAFMEACRAELTIEAAYVTAHPTFVLEVGGRTAGFCTLERRTATEVELGHLFVEPDGIGRGLGRRLMAHACAEARGDGYETMVIQGDPHAMPFYRAVGARQVGTRPSASVPGRALPLLRLDLGTPGAAS